MMVELTIDGRRLTVDGHTTVLEAARKVGVPIPTFCHHAHLSPLGACRMCLVEVEGMGKLQTACTLPVGEGMKVWTATPRVEEARRAMLEFLLINHVLECPVCEASGECTLQDFTFRYGSGETRFTERKRVLRDHIISPLIDRNLNRCIQCKRCVRICDEVQGVTALGMSFRGAQTVVGPFMEKSLDCEFCSHCIWACPVGAITSRVMKHRIRTWEMEKVEAVCPYCSDGCLFHYNRKDNLVLKVTHAEGKGLAEGSLCSKGYFGFDVIHHDQRLTAPLVRKEGILVTSSWEEALPLVATRLLEIVRRDGGQAVGGIASDRLTNEELYLFQKLFRAVLGSDNIDTASGFWRRAMLPVLEERLGVAAATNSLEELEYADNLLLVGCDLTVTAPITGLLVKRGIRRGASATEVTYRRTALSRLARRTFLVPPGRELALVKAMMGVIVAENLYLPAVRKWEGFEVLAASVREKDPAAAAAEAGASPAVTAAAARDFARGPRSSILFGEMAVLQPGGRELLSALVDLFLLTGRAGQEGCGLYPVFPGTNTQGAADMGTSAGCLPGHAAWDDRTARERLESLWGVRLPPRAGLDAAAMMKGAREGRLRALFLAGSDPAASFPGREKTAESLGKLEFLVVSDLFLTETAASAHVVLPACSLAERAGTLTNAERRIQRTSRAIEPVGNSLPDWKILSSLGASLGASLGTPFRYSNPWEVLEEIAEAVPFYSGISHRILADNGLLWPFTMSDAKEVYHEGYLGTRRLFPEGAPPEKRRFAAVAGWGREAAGGDYPVALVVGDLLFHSGVFTRHSESLGKLVSGAVLLLDPQAAGELGIPGGGLVKVVSAAGDLVVKAHPSADLLPGCCFLPRHFPSSHVTRLMQDGSDGKPPETAVIPVRLEKP